VLSLSDLPTGTGPRVRQTADNSAGWQMAFLSDVGDSAALSPNRRLQVTLDASVPITQKVGLL
jgi:hypothetical protein